MQSDNNQGIVCVSFEIWSKMHHYNGLQNGVALIKILQVAVNTYNHYCRLIMLKIWMQECYKL